ncbi:SAG family member [Eimeria maxima]|uniref:SAG family member n=1 Tax=Eimeria maxima TaxID=5804 RepID=U6M650_EIMMA|nr:SAG family member [Eimeria maxima]CDJ57949.1 SAG family member [Eimeria maxima]
MGSREFLYATGVVLLLLGRAPVPTQAASGQPPSYSQVLGDTGACLPEINKARELAGLTSFAQATATDGGQLPLDSAYQLWRIPCDPLVPAEEQFKGSNELLYKTAFAAFEVSPDTPNCTEAVDHWNAAFTNFQEYVLPPPNDMSTKLYSNRDNISFVAVYNPAKTATADCRVFTCTRTTPASSVAGDSNSNPAKTEDSSSSLICLTTPDILTLNGPAPFTYVYILKRQEEWEKIKAAFARAGSAGKTMFNEILIAATILLGLVASWKATPVLARASYVKMLLLLPLGFCILVTLAASVVGEGVYIFNEGGEKDN